MSEWLYDYRERRDGITIPTIWVAIALSALVHILMLGKWLPQIEVRLPSLEEIEKGETSRSLVVQLAPPAAPAPAPPPSPSHAQRAQPAPTFQAAPSLGARPRPAPPPVMALNNPAPNATPPAPATAPSAAPAPPAATSDLSSYIEAQRRARMASAAPSPFSPSAGRAPAAPPVEDENARGDRAIAANLGLNRAPTYGPDATKRGGGVFQIQRLNYSDAEFLFYGWNKDIRRNTTQLIEVRKGDASDIRLAIVRRMIEIIREYEQGDFLWESQRLGRNVMKSARLRDTAELEDFMLLEFFQTTQVQR